MRIKIMMTALALGAVIYLQFFVDWRQMLKEDSQEAPVESHESR